MSNHEPSPLDRATRYGLIFLAVMQGYALTFLHLALEGSFWPATDQPWLYGLYSLFLGLPAFFYLGIERLRDRRNAIAAAIIGMLLFYLGWHMGWVSEGKGLANNKPFHFIAAYTLSFMVILFILAFFFRAWCQTDRFLGDYRQLLTLSWHHALTVLFLGLFVAAFWLLLVLWAGLFDAIGIEFFDELFFKPSFVYPVTWLVIGLGLVLIRDRISLVATIQHMCEALIKALLPLAALIIIIFLATLPFVGLQPIWDTGSAALLMMMLTLVLLFFFNAVLSDRPDAAPYSRPIRWAVFIAVALLPITVAIAAWALWLRVDQYGFTLDRLWAAVIQLLIAAYTLVYAVLIIWRRERALTPIQTANTYLALGIAAVLILVHSPIADLRAWAAESQTQRLFEGKVEVDEFDYNYLRFSLGTYGVQYLQAIRDSQFANDNPAVVNRIDAVMAKTSRYDQGPGINPSDSKAVANIITTRPGAITLPQDLAKLIKERQARCLNSSGQCVAMRVTSNASIIDWLVFNRTLSEYDSSEYSGNESKENSRRRYISGKAYALQDERWFEIGTIGNNVCQKQRDMTPKEVLSLMPEAAPFLVFSNGVCFYSIQPTKDYLLDRWRKQSETRNDEKSQINSRS